MKPEAKIQIYTLTHKPFEIPTDPMYVPLQVGAEQHEDLGYLKDNTGQNISALNWCYSELTGLYWIWKNDKISEYVGTCHYRRYLINEQEKILNRQEIEKILLNHDLITTRKVHLNNSYHFGFSANHNGQALDTVGEVIRDLYPEYHSTFSELVHGPDTYFGNMLIAKKEIFDAYAEWLFTIFAEVEKRIDLNTDEDAYHKRVFGFISEFLLLVWVTVQKLKVYECKVGMIGEKAETREVKQTLQNLIEQKKIEEAKDYFLKMHAKRPDLLMEASDINGELHLTLQIIATADAEQKAYGSSFLEEGHSFVELLSRFGKLNSYITSCIDGEDKDDVLERYSQIAVEIAKLLYKRDRVTI